MLKKNFLHILPCTTVLQTQDHHRALLPSLTVEMETCSRRRVGCGGVEGFIVEQHLRAAQPGAHVVQIVHPPEPEANQEESNRSGALPEPCQARYAAQGKFPIATACRQNKITIQCGKLPVQATHKQTLNSATAFTSTHTRLLHFANTPRRLVTLLFYYITHNIATIPPVLPAPPPSTPH